MPNQQNVTRHFWWFALGQGALWFLLPLLLFANLPPDAIAGLAWGQAWPLGTYKYPPLHSWLLEIAVWLGGRTDAGIYALGAGCLVLTYWALWRLGKMLLPLAVAHMGVVATCGCLAFGAAIVACRPESVLLPFYALCALLFWRAFTLDLWRDWLLLGVMAGLGLCGKYSFVFMLLSFAVFIVWEPQARAIVNRPKAWMALIVVVLVFLPHLNWLLENHWLPFVYAAAQAKPTDGWFAGLFAWLHDQGIVLLTVAPVVLLCWLARERKAFVWPEMTAGLRYLTVLAWAPFLLHIVTTLLTGSWPHDPWNLALWPFFGLWGAARWGSQWAANIETRHLAIVFMLGVPLTLTNGFPTGLAPEGTTIPNHMQGVAQQAERLWAQQGWRSPLTIVLGDEWLGGNIAWHSKTRPRLMYYGSAFYSPGVTEAMVRKQGALVIWDIHKDGEDIPKWALRHGGVGDIYTFRIFDSGRGVMVSMGVLAPQE